MDLDLDLQGQDFAIGAAAAASSAAGLPLPLPLPLPLRPVRSLLTEAMCAATKPQTRPAVTAGFDGARIHTVLPVSAPSRLL